MNRIAITGVLATVLALGTALPASAQTQIPVADYTVFVDPPTGFVFVKLPAGWKFVGSVSKDDVAHVPASVVTALLPPDEQQLAANGKAAPPPRAKRAH